MLWLPLFVLTCMIALLGWITKTVYPEMWAVGEQFGLPPKRGEVFCWKMTKVVTHVIAVMWWLVVVGLVFG